MRKTSALKATLLLFCFILSLPTANRAQSITRYNTFSYNVNEGLQQSTIGDIEFDTNNFLWISFPNGIQKFDGNNFTTVLPQPGLPDDKNVSFFRDRKGELFISHSQGISRYDINANRFVLIYQQPGSFVKPALFMGEDDSIIYMYDEEGVISGLDTRNSKIVSAVRTGFPSFRTNVDNYPKLCKEVINHKTAFLVGDVIHLWDLRNSKELSSSVSLPYRSIFFLKLMSETEVLYYDYRVNTAIQSWNFATSTNTTLYIKGKKNNRTSRCVIYPWKEKTLISFDNNLYETDSTLQVLKSELVNFQNQPVAGGVGIAQIREDGFGNLCLQTINGGIRKMIRNNYPIKYYGQEKSSMCNALCVFADKTNNRVFIGTSVNGLLIFDTLQRLVKNIQFLPGNNTQPFSVTNMVKDPGGDYFLFMGGQKKLWRLRHDLSSMYPVPFSTSLPAVLSGIHYFSNVLFRDDKEAVVQSQGKFYRINFKNGNVSEQQLFKPDVLSGTRYKQDIIVHSAEELVFLDAITFSEKKRIPFANTGGVRCFTKDKDEHIYIGSNKGIFKIDSTGRILYHWTKENGLPDDCIYAIAVNPDKNIWASCNKGIFRIDTINNIFQLTKDDGLQENEFNTGVVATAEDGELFFGGINGVSSFFPKAINSYNEKVNILLTRIRVNNTDIKNELATWNIRKLKLSYNENSLSFDFLAMGNNNPGQYIYQYRMKGVDKEWIQNTDLQTVRYSLAPGKYTFQILASRSFNKDSKPMKEISIYIQQPFWKRWWFIGGAILCFIGIIAYVINIRSRRKYERKLHQLENEQELKNERERISKDLHDNLGAYANAVIYNTELLEKETSDINRNELITGLRFASRDIITSLRETVWALKKEAYTSEECLVRIRNFIQPLSRYYPKINFSVEGAAQAGKSFHYTKALNLVRIIQEAVSNSIKHSQAKHISLVSSIEENRWKLAIKDDGSGFDVDEATKMEQGNGLGNMQHRALESGFGYYIESKKNRGTIITLIV